MRVKKECCYLPDTSAVLDFVSSPPERFEVLLNNRNKTGGLFLRALLRPRNMLSGSVAKYSGAAARNTLNLSPHYPKYTAWELESEGRCDCKFSKLMRACFCLFVFALKLFGT